MSRKENKRSYDCKLCTGPIAAREYGVGGFWYDWVDGSEMQFPRDVAAVWVMMDVAEQGEPENIAAARWTVSKPNHCGAQWSLSGTQEKPTLSPSLHWVDVWHGYLQNGKMRSC